MAAISVLSQPLPLFTAAAGSAPADRETIWKQAFERDAQVRAEFREVETYVAFKKHEAAGDVRIVGGKVGNRPAAVSGSTSVVCASGAQTVWKQEFECDAALQAEFGTVERYMIFKRHEAAGDVRIFRRRLR